jgi:hypothetical protein
MLLTKSQIGAVTALAQQEIPSDVFGGSLLIREMTRATFRGVREYANKGGSVNVDDWNAGLFAAVVIDPATNTPMYTLSEVLEWANRPALWDEIIRIASLGLDLSEVKPESLKSEGDPVHD